MHKVWVGKNNATYELPNVVFEPSNFSERELTHQGFLIAKTEDLNNEKMDDYSSTIQDFIKKSDTNKGVSYGEPFLIFKKGSDLDKPTLYNRYSSLKKGNDALTITYWAQYKNKIVWSKPVSIALK
ncbi:hypothetical protein [Cardinium endosymbiont of Nabis limbatus]|uniref:hypothetical protein n=1 Tax=Cardinium endosymbiont of Nabis limbatus TaxID=3066217 RepID=UPI003AF3D94A